MNYSVNISQPAEEDLNQIVDYIVVQLAAPAAALDFIEHFSNVVSSLKSYPHRCSMVRDEEFQLHGFRKIFVKNYIVFFTANETEQTVFINRVLYNRRNWTDII